MSASAEMLVNLGVPYVILGHSERRTILNESNEVSPGMRTLIEQCTVGAPREEMNGVLSKKSASNGGSELQEKRVQMLMGDNEMQTTRPPPGLGFSCTTYILTEWFTIRRGQTYRRTQV